MKKEEYKKLEELLIKLKVELGFSYCIIPECIQDGYHIGLYNAYGDKFKDATHTTIESTVKKLK